MSNSTKYIFVTSYTNAKKEVEYSIHSTKRNINYRIIEVGVKGLYKSRKYSYKKLEYAKEIEDYSKQMKDAIKEIQKIGKAIKNRNRAFIIKNKDDLIKILDSLKGKVLKIPN